jgi:AraC-like DNA-binding protein
MADAHDWTSRYALASEFITRRLAEAPAPRPELVLAWKRLREGNVRVEAIAREVGWSRRHLSARFRDGVGVTPKEAARILRFRRVIERLRAGAREPLGDIALDAGYYDQAHMNRDFRELAGCSPGRFPFVQDDAKLVA